MTPPDPRIVDLAAAGYSPTEVAEALGVPVRAVGDGLRAAALSARARIADIAEERALVADARIEMMLRKVMRLVEAIPFDDKVYKIALGLLERQARLFGYDRGKGTSETADWMTGAGMTKLMEYAKTLGVASGEKFDGP